MRNKHTTLPARLPGESQSFNERLIRRLRYGVKIMVVTSVPRRVDGSTAANSIEDEGMKIEYLAEGCSDCPLIRIYGNEPSLIQQLCDVFDKLHHGDKNTFALHDLKGYEAINGVKLFASLERKDRGIIRLKENNVFQCILTDETWAQVADLVRPFCKPTQGTRFQWLDETSDISLLITTSDAGIW